MPRVRRGPLSNASEPKPPSEIEEFCKTGFGLSAGAVAACRALPAAHALAAQHGPQGYRDVATKLRERIESLLKKLASNPITGLESLDEANDNLLQRLEINLATLSGEPLPPAAATLTIPGPLDPRSIFPKQVQRPQFLFKDKVDNSNSLWVPKIKEKPNSLTPLNITEEIDITGRPIGFVHPYMTEINQYQPPEEFIQLDFLPKLFLKENLDTPLTHIDNEVDLDFLVKHLRRVKEIAVDLEHHSYRTFQGITCLIQISTDEGGDFLLDALYLREHLHHLNEAFTNPKILKVFHGADQDILWLQRDFGVYVVGMFDTYRASMELGLPQLSLEALLHKYCKVETDKRLRLADWRVRPLSDELCEYARTDTHNLLYIWRRMRKDLIDFDRGQSNRLRSVFESSKNVCARTYFKPEFDKNGHTDLITKSKRILDSRQKQALKMLYKWRDETARQEDESIGYVLPNHMLLEIASNMPKEPSGILACCIPTPPLVVQNLTEIYHILNIARTTPLEKLLQTETQPEDSHKESFTPMIYERQSIGELNGKSSFLNGRLLDLNKKFSKISMMSSSMQNSISTTTDNLAVTDCFAPPYDRYMLIKKYNESMVEINKSKPIAENKTTSVSADGKSISIVEKQQKESKKISHQSENSNATEQIKKKKMQQNEVVHKINEKNLSKNNEIVDSTFQPFDYKSYDYRKFGKQPKENPRKRKRNKSNI